MSTFMQKKENIVRKCYIVDAANRPLGKTAVVVANLLRGKNAPEFTPNVDCGNFVFVINADKAVLTGKKLEQKYYRHHSGYIGGLKSVQYKTLMQNRPELAVELAVKGMLPHNSLGASAFTRLKVFASEEAFEKAKVKYAGLKPEVYEEA
ncbi:MAG: 50S ribosomal protein L13 [Clostridia bacterium]|nr:50S ribosomal protein L13 [Clostridia bacterium]